MQGRSQTATDPLLDSVQQSVQQTTDLSVAEPQPMAEACLREAARHTEGTSGFFLAAAASCAIPTTRQLVRARVRMCVRVRVRNRCALRPRRQRAP